MTESTLAIFRSEYTPLSLFVLFFLLVFIERAYYFISHRKDYNDANALGSMGVVLLNTFVRIVLAILIPFTLYLALYPMRLFDIPVTLWSFALLFLIQELIWYGCHRLGHRSGIFWAFHHVHHSSPEMNFSVAARGFVFDDTSRIVLAGGVALLGFRFEQYLMLSLTLDFIGIFSHSSAIRKLGWFDKWFATPANHRVHHAINDQYIDKNYGHILMHFDKLFGSFEPEVEEPTFGVKEQINTNNPVKIYLAGFKWLHRKIQRAETLGDKIKCVFLPPEWEPPQAMPAVSAKPQ